MLIKSLVIHPSDNVAVLLMNGESGDSICVRNERDEDEEISLVGAVPFGHKISMSELGQGEPIIKYGEEIGTASVPIQKGEWVHTHNLYCGRGK